MDIGNLFPPSLVLLVPISIQTSLVYTCLGVHLLAVGAEIHRCEDPHWMNVLVFNSTHFFDEILAQGIHES